MKIPAIILVSWLGLWSASAQDTIFGKQVGPFVPSQGATPAPSAPLPPFLQPLGPLQSNLKAWFSFNGRENGGLAWSSALLDVKLTDEAVLREATGGRVADFSAPGAVLAFGTPLTLGPRYTLAAWVSFPIKNKKTAILFRGTHDDFLNVETTGLFSCWVGGKARAFGTQPVPFTGWHHLAVIVDGKQSSVYLDGRLYGSIPVPIADDLATIGNHPDPKFRSDLMSTAMDDVFVFDRDLSPVELAKLIPVRFPTTGPATGLGPMKNAFDLQTPKK